MKAETLRQAVDAAVVLIAAAEDALTASENDVKVVRLGNISRSSQAVREAAIALSLRLNDLRNGDWVSWKGQAK